jgi:hypothetical protein
MIEFLIAAVLTFVVLIVLIPLALLLVQRGGSKW